MAKYMVPGSQTTVSSSYKTGALVYAGASATRRGKVCDIILGSIGLPLGTDCYIQFDLSRFTVGSGWTSTPFTPNPVDPADAPCSAVAGVNATVEGSITSNSSLFNVGMNQRGSSRWQEQDESKMLIYPATSLYGVRLAAQSSTYNVGVSTQIGFLE